MQLMKKTLLPLFFSAVFFAGCTVSAPLDDTAQIQSKALSESGTLEKKPLNIFEDGTHYLLKENGERVLLKSSFVDLSDFEDRSVTITGEQKEGTNTPFEVFQVDVERAPLDERPAQYAEKDFLFSAELPASWSRTLKNGVLGFAPENSDSAITIVREANSPEMRSKIALGQIISLGKKSATKWVDGDQIDIFVPETEKNTLIHFHFSPQRNSDFEKLVFFEMLSGLEWTESEEIPVLPAEESVPEKTIFCGGVAKKLCPTGFRCDLESFEPDATGVCVDAKTPPKSIETVIDAALEESSPPVKEEESSFTEKTTEVTEGFLEYENARFGYRFSLPSSWHWQHIGARDGYLSVLQISEKESFEDADIIAEIRIKNEVGIPGSSEQDGNITVVVPRDSSTHFEVWGIDSFSEEIQKIASSFSF